MKIEKKGHIKQLGFHCIKPRFFGNTSTFGMRKNRRLPDKKIVVLLQITTKIVVMRKITHIVNGR
jgi:hypothetical protein